jgi:hypothetical protein
MNEINIIIEALEKITSNTDSTYEWDDLMSVQFKGKEAEALRQLCWQVSDAFPPAQNEWYCNDAGMAVLKTILSALKGKKTGLTEFVALNFTSQKSTSRKISKNH